MKLLRLLPILIVPAAASAANREIVELQRDVAALQDQVRTLQRSLDEKLSALQVVVQQSLDAANKNSTAVAVIESSIRNTLNESSKTLVEPVAGLGTKLEQMTTEFQSVKESVTDLTSRMNKLQLQIVDLSNLVKVMQAPPAAPPPGASPSAAAPPAGMSAKQVYDNALRDKTGGNLDLAVQGFSEYLKYFADTELAPAAQYHIGDIQYSKADFQNAVQSFDLVLEKYPENSKTADAMYMKGMALLRSGQRTEAAKEFLNVIQQHPTSDVAAKARTQRRALGLSVPAEPSKRRVSRR